MIFLALINIFTIGPYVVFKGTNILLWKIVLPVTVMFVHAVIENNGTGQEVFPHID